jgi:hypothetical protein
VGNYKPQKPTVEDDERNIKARNTFFAKALKCDGQLRPKRR